MSEANHTVRTASGPIRILLVDDQVMLRAAMKSLLGQQPGVEVVGDCGDARSAVESVRELRPDVVLLDISMPGLSGLDAIAPLRSAHPGLRVLMLSHHEADTFVDRAMRFGADGFLTKNSEPEELLLALRSVHEGRSYLTPKVTSGLVTRLRTGEPGAPTSSSRVESLTTREREVFQLLALGRSNKEVAHELGITLGTAKKHRENVQRKLDCHSTAELARLAIREGLLDS